MVRNDANSDDGDDGDDIADNDSDDDNAANCRSLSTSARSRSFSCLKSTSSSITSLLGGTCIVEPVPIALTGVVGSLTGVVGSYGSVRPVRPV